MSGKPFSPAARWEADPPEPQLRPPEPWLPPARSDQVETDRETGQLQADIGREPQAVIQVEKAKAVRPGQTLGQSSPAEQGLIQTGAAL